MRTLAAPSWHSRYLSSNKVLTEGYRGRLALDNPSLTSTRGCWPLPHTAELVQPPAFAVLLLTVDCWLMCLGRGGGGPGSAVMFTLVLSLGLQEGAFDPEAPLVFLLAASCRSYVARQT